MLLRKSTRYTTRMLAGIPRPAPPDYFKLACRAIEEAMKIRVRLMPFLEEQARIAEEERYMASWIPILDKVYGTTSPPSAYKIPPPILGPEFQKKAERQLELEKRALLKSEMVIHKLLTKLNRTLPQPIRL